MRSLFATRFNADILDQNYALWKSNPASVDKEWSAFFEGFELGSAHFPKPRAAQGSGAPGFSNDLQTKVDALVYGYRTLGHSIAILDPLATEPPSQPLLELREFGLSEGDLDTVVSSKFFLGGQAMPLRDLLGTLHRIYGGTVAAEFMHIQNPRVRNFIRDRFESRISEPPPDTATLRHLLNVLMEAETFERFLHMKYVGQKRFSLEGGESLMVILDTILQGCPGYGVKEIVMGMAHRGRLTVLANFLRKSLRTVFTEFSENYIPNLTAGDGDVKYHLGYKTLRKTLNGHQVRIELSSNPSHLEAVNAVVEGKARARQRINDDSVDRRSVLPLLLHGDAAFAGQGVVAEVLNLSQLPGYRTGGTVHVIVNNQIGFTTLPADARSSEYATDVAKMIEAPILHVNGDDPAAVYFTAKLALEIRQQFSRDVVIDMFCYRRHGHNEGDEPVFTQPNMYAKIAEHPSVWTSFKEALTSSGILTLEETREAERVFENTLESARVEVKEAETNGQSLSVFAESTATWQPPYSHEPVETAISDETLSVIVDGLTRVPDGFEILPKIRRMLLERRREVHANGGPYDWGFAEALAFGSLMLEGIPVRLSGQDSRRGTFSHRHSVLYEAKTRERYIPLMNLREGQARFCVYNSLLSEAAVLGFDYGYSLGFPNMLCLWEAQFGDFANGAQVVIDQFISSAESKWQTPSGIVLLLPHGYEGMGPEHSSARLERFLTLCAEDNIQVCNLTTPAQYFHVLRRQMRRPFRKPLVIMTPKSLLRSELAVSTTADFTSGRFHDILETPLLGGPEEIRRVIFCSGKVAYDLLRHRDANNIRDAAIIRIEQLYPMDYAALTAATERFPADAKWVWCQEEPQNMGAWTHILPVLGTFGRRYIWFAGRDAAASPAVGSLAAHKREQQQLVHDAFNG